MFSGIGIWEVLLIIVVILVVLGPQRVPEIARKLGQAVRTIRKASSDLTTTMSRELDVSGTNPPKSHINKEKSADSPSVADKVQAETQENPPEDKGEA